MTAPRTLYDKLWDAHVVGASADGETLLYIDRVILHEVTSAQAFEGLRLARRNLWRPDALFAVADHQVPTTNRAQGMAGFTDLIAKQQVQALDDNCQRYGVDQIKLSDLRQGIGLHAREIARFLLGGQLLAPRGVDPLADHAERFIEADDSGFGFALDDGTGHFRSFRRRLRVWWRRHRSRSPRWRSS